ncbi:glycosyltransferase [Kineococcus sp. NPDC059986]|uniref:glycosyltransferase n=1 Tax=Kineococcus sp. NPDC059986 TaxID=3155538 RepID=UPI00344B7689
MADSLRSNGAVSITVDLARRWADAGARLLVLSSTPGERTPPAGTVVERLAPRTGRLREGVLRGLPHLVARARGADIVVTASEIGPGVLVGFLAARLGRRPFVVAVHADLDEALQEWVPRRLHGLTRFVHRHADGALAVAAALVDPLVRNGLPADRIRVVRNGVDLEAIRNAARSGAGLLTGDPAPRTVPVVVATGRLAPQKGYDLLLRAHARVVADHPHRVLVLNDGPERAGLQQLAAELGVTGSVEFAGADVPLLPTVAAADLFALPSRHEGLPLALLEALALGVPVVAADCAEGVRVALDGGRAGRLVPVEDVDALADALRAHLQDPGPLRELAARGLEHVRAFDRGPMAQAWVDALNAFR